MLFVPLILFLGATVGHAALVITSINRLYGRAINRDLLRFLRKLHSLLVLAGPLVFWFAFIENPGGIWQGEPSFSWLALVQAYGMGCCVIGLGWLPLVTLNRLLRRPPAALQSNHTRTIDVAKLLGYKPSGHGKHRRLAGLPLNQCFQVDFSERTLCLPRLPAAWEGLTILHLSDLHLCGTPDREFYQHVMDTCRDWDPDLVALTGDVVDTNRHHRWIVPLLGRLRWRIAAFAILGNHDFSQDHRLVRRRLSRVGMTVLANDWKQIEVRGEPLVAIGHEGPWFQPEPDLTTCPTGTFRLCLSHTPDNIRWARDHGIDLMLAGHVHGGQIRFPVLGSVFVPSRYSRRYDCGTFDEPPTVLHVSRGLAGKEPLRYNCRPEVTKLVLRSTKTAVVETRGRAGSEPAACPSPAKGLA